MEMLDFLTLPFDCLLASESVKSKLSSKPATVLWSAHLLSTFLLFFAPVVLSVFPHVLSCSRPESYGLFVLAMLASHTMIGFSKVALPVAVAHLAGLVFIALQTVNDLLHNPVALFASFVLVCGSLTIHLAFSKWVPAAASRSSAMFFSIVVGTLYGVALFFILFQDASEVWNLRVLAATSLGAIVTTVYAFSPSVPFAVAASPLGFVFAVALLRHHARLAFAVFDLIVFGLFVSHRHGTANNASNGKFVVSLFGLFALLVCLVDMTAFGQSVLAATGFSSDSLRVSTLLGGVSTASYSTLGFLMAFIVTLLSASWRSLYSFVIVGSLVAVLRSTVDFAPAWGIFRSFSAVKNLRYIEMLDSFDPNLLGTTLVVFDLIVLALPFAVLVRPPKRFDESTVMVGGLVGLLVIWFHFVNGLSSVANTGAYTFFL
eukprot:ANDGO_08255.mRNA.1 hypothetical protein